MATAPANNPAARTLRSEGLILDRVRHHLRQAAASGTVAEVVFRFSLHHGGVSATRVGVRVEYEFLEDRDAF